MFRCPGTFPDISSGSRNNPARSTTGIPALRRNRKIPRRKRDSLSPRSETNVGVRHGSSRRHHDKRERLHLQQKRPGYSDKQSVDTRSRVFRRTSSTAVGLCAQASPTGHQRRSVWRPDLWFEPFPCHGQGGGKTRATGPDHHHEWALEAIFGPRMEDRVGGLSRQRVRIAARGRTGGTAACQVVPRSVPLATVRDPDAVVAVDAGTLQLEEELL
mmetsp:Transcript_8445/g.17581  ORF Transcript_8445/g.17581 Transcript_8445/m.17581 type:complete len:215 (-) Transcript_8445:425-1069(-)